MLNVVEVNSLYKYNDEKNAIIKDINLKVQEGSLHAIIGHNGSGKTTLLRIIAGLIKPSRGEVHINYSREPRKLFFLPETYFFPGFMYVNELLDAVKVAYSAFDNSNKKLFEDLGVEHLFDRKYGSLSHGERKRIGLALAFASNSPLIILDEPLEGVDPDMRKVVSKLLATQTQKENTTIIFTSHETINFTLKIATDITLMRNGHIIGTFSTNKLINILINKNIDISLVNLSILYDILSLNDY